MLGAVRDDVRLAVRSTMRRPAFLVVAAGTLALGIGATTAMYSALEAVVLNPMPFPTSNRLVKLYRTYGPGGPSVMLTPEREQIERLREQQDVFDAFAAYGGGAATLTGVGEPERVRTLKASAELAAIMGVQPVLGRFFLPEDVAGDGERVVLLSHAFWRGRLGARRDVVGEAVQIDGDAWTIVGVMPREAVRPNGDALAIDIWMPLADNESFRAWIARLAEGVTLETAAARVNAVTQAAEVDPMRGTAVPVRQAGLLHDHLRLLMIAVSLLLLVACVNVSNLLLQRAATRSRETAVRAALGAGRGRLVRQFLLESTTLALIGGVLGAGLAWLGLRALLALRPERLAALHHVRMDGGVLLFCLLTAVGAGMLFGLLPALHASRTSATAALGRAGRDAHAPTGRFGWMLVSAEVAFSFALLIGSALVISSLRDLSARDPGFRVDGLISVDVRLPSWRYDREPLRAAIFERLLDQVRRLPGVQVASLADGVPPRLGGAFFGHVEVEGQPREGQPAIVHSILADADYLRALGQPLIAGRDFAHRDGASDERPVILTAAAAHRLFPGREAIGRRFRIEGPPDYTVVGVAGDVLATGLADEGRTPLGYWRLETVRARMTLVVRAARTDPRFLLELRQIVRRTEPHAIVEIATARELLASTLARERFTTSLLTTFAALALLLAAVGLYGVLSQVVVARTPEIGVRMALGADAARIRRLILGRGLAATGAGLVLGALLAAAGLRLMRSEVFGLGDGQPAAYVTAAAVLLAVALAAMMVPTSRAARLDPMRAIRVD